MWIRGSIEYPQSLFGSTIRKIGISLYTPILVYKMGYNRLYIKRTCYRSVFLFFSVFRTRVPRKPVASARRLRLDLAQKKVLRVLRAVLVTETKVLIYGRKFRGHVPNMKLIKVIRMLRSHL